MNPDDKIEPGDRVLVSHDRDRWRMDFGTVVKALPLLPRFWVVWLDKEETVTAHEGSLEKVYL